MGQCGPGNRAETKSVMNGSNTNFTKINYSDINSNFSLTSTLNTSHINNIFNVSRWFPKGEQYYKIIKDSNKTNLLENKNDWQSEKVELFFSLLNLVKPKQLYSLSVTIINNNRLGIESYLGDLDQNCGENLYFGNSFEIDYFYERQQKIIVRPIINNKRLNLEYSFILGDVMRTQNKTHEVTEPAFGTLKINALSLNNYKNNIDFSKIISNFKFNITLVNINTLVAPNFFFVINHFKDGEIVRPV